MRLALTYNLKTANVESEQEFDAPQHVNGLLKALRSLKHTVHMCEVTGSAKGWMPQLLRYAPDTVFNIAEGSRGRAREGVFPSLFEAYGLKYTGSDAYTLTLTLDKWLTKRFLRERDVACSFAKDCLLPGPSRPSFGSKRVILKPNFEGSSKGITPTSVGTVASLRGEERRLLTKYPDGVLYEEFVDGFDLTVPWLELVGPLQPIRVMPTTKRAQTVGGIYDYRQKGLFCGEVEHRVYPHPEAMAVTADVAAKLRLRGLARVDFRVDSVGRLWFLEVNALPSLEYDGTFPASANASGLSYQDVLSLIIKSARK